MSIKFIKAAVFVLAGSVAFSAPVLAQEAQSLDQLLSFVKKGQVTEARENRKREQAFKNAKAEQAKMLKAAEARRAEEEARSAKLEDKFSANELMVTEKQSQLKERLGALTELFGHLTSAAGDMRVNLENSITSAQYPGREKFMSDLVAKMSAAEQLPSIEEIEQVWYELQREMTESGKVVTFEAELSHPDGTKVHEKVMRVGTFNLVSADGKYLQYVPSKGTVEELARQPSGPYSGWAENLIASDSGMHKFGVDPTGPSGGSFLAALINSPTLEERWHQGGYIGYAITAVGAFAFLLAIWRLIVLTGVGAKVNRQLKSDTAMENNPLGRVLKIHEDNPSMDPETLELKLNEGILKETPKLETGLTLLKIISAIAPLMGLLGTVTGMIITFQAITIFGAGDPKAMAGGISGALVTTVLGLLVAIPTVLLHTVVNGRAQRIIHVLNEQATGIVAEHTEANQRK
ncbi:MAG: energy transducer TonB [Gammaproteobacteria bacterium]|nr:MAG: energy transducer TonB [Gammaproteobacteria bacterium]